MDQTIRNDATCHTDKLKRKWLIIETAKHPAMGFTDRQLLISLHELGIDAHTIQEGNIDQLPALLRKHEYEGVYWEGLAGWNAWSMIRDLECRKINAWYDDPVMRMDLAHKRSTFVDGFKMGVEFYVWDSYWIDQLKWQYGIDAKLCHLAANSREYYTSTLNVEPINKPVFIGSLHSSRWIAYLKQKMRDPFVTMIRAAESDLKKVPHVRSWDVLEGAYVSALGDGEARVFRDLCYLDKDLQWTFRQCLWAMSKNEVRTRMLRSALEVSSVIMVSECKSLNHTTEDEIRRLVGDKELDLEFHDSSRIDVERLGVFYHYGWIHMQATDPQSMHEGFPYRMYQTMASGRVLLTDLKDNWEKHFNVGTDIIGYEAMDEFKDKLNHLLKNKPMCKEIGAKARKTFEEQHQWKTRLEGMFNANSTT